MVRLDDYQIDAIRRMRDGCILCGGVGTGKSRTGLGYFYKEYGGKLSSDSISLMKDPPDLYIITTAKKRDNKEWEEELSMFNMSENDNSNFYDNHVHIDSWNNIGKYTTVEDSFFIFDEQRVVGYGAWTKAFLKICKRNRWIMLSATPGDKWEDYIPVFMANGYYRTKGEFTHRHIVYKPMVRFPQVDRYVETHLLMRLRDQVLVTMESQIQANEIHNDILCSYDVDKYKQVVRTRQNPYLDNMPIESASEYCYILRHIVNEDPTRGDEVLNILRWHERAIIFYCFNYELEILKALPYEEGTKIAEWNGHKHQDIPEGEKWVYLVQYTAGAEGWNCITTDTMIFYSQSYSYKATIQAAGRINRRNTPYKDLFYYHLKSKSTIDLGIGRSLKSKKEFNARGFAKNIVFRKDKDNENQNGQQMAEPKRREVSGL